ncbi:MAG: HD-GYP domain-containing protein [Candidatus Electrothrix sp. GW3-4]|uniref:HD-GYP domain-containing protein n=1 Tax=Candidatus Electrothrix sp. GW3-4 TaxID=3126740 RepID=UPI0030D24133
MSATLNNLIVLLCKGIGQRKIYFTRHPILTKTCQHFVDNLNIFFSERETEELFIGIVENKLVHDGQYLIGPSIMGLQLVTFAQQIHCGGFVFRARTAVKDLQELLELSDHITHSVGSLQEARDFLAAHNVTNIKLARHYTAPSTLIPLEDQVVWQGEDSSGNLYTPLLIYQALFDVVAKAYGNVSLNRTLDIDGAQTVSEHLLSYTRLSFSDILQFVHYPDHDSYTVGHSVRVATLAVFFGNALGFDDEKLVELGAAALLHDIGKGKIPSEILHKQGKLNHDEFALIQSHPKFGAEILLEHKDVTPMQLASAWGHHIRYDGGGYPKPPPWAVYSHVTALLHICDVFEALTAVRPYKPSISPLSAFGIMAQDKGDFDPALFFAFVSALGIYPPGNQVRLSNGWQGMVIASSAAIDKPVVRINRDNTGKALEMCDQHLIDLSKDPKGELTVVELLT